MNNVEMVRKVLYACKGTVDKLTRSIKFISAGQGNCKGTFVVEEAHVNLLGSLHGGFASTLVDNISNLGLLTHKYGGSPSVSISLNLDFYKAAYVGDELLLDAKTVKVGKNVAFLEIDVFNNATKELIMKGNHVKHFILDPNAAKNSHKWMRLEEDYKN